MTHRSDIKRLIFFDQWIIDTDDPDQMEAYEQELEMRRRDAPF